jgi:DNA-binding CsgD family transcriptional regulator
MSNLERLIRAAKGNDERAMLEIIGKFKPLIGKYYAESGYDEDMRSALELKLVEVVKNGIDFEEFRSRSEGAFVNHIVSSLYHEYLAISKKKRKTQTHEILCEDDSLMDSIMAENAYTDGNIHDTPIEDGILFEALRSILTEREFDCVYFTTVESYTSEEIAKRLRVTKQAVNQCKLRAYGKIRDYFNNGND